MLDVPEALVVSAIHPAFTDKQAYIIRLANPTNTQMFVSEEVTKLGVQVNALEELVENSSTIRPYDFISIKIQVK